MPKAALIAGLEEIIEQVLPSSNFCDSGTLEFFFFFFPLNDISHNSVVPLY